MNTQNISFELHQRIRQAVDQARKFQVTIMLTDGTKFTYPDAAAMEDLDAIDEQLDHLSRRCDWS